MVFRGRVFDRYGICLVDNREAARVFPQGDRCAHVLWHLTHTEPQARNHPDADLRLAIDLRIQCLAEESIADKPGAVVVLDVLNGDVLALASSPGFEPNELNQSTASPYLDWLQDDPRQPLLNRAISAAYAPASTMKPIVAMAALNSGVATEGTAFDCPGYYDLGHTKVPCWISTYGAVHGVVELRQALERSCSTFFSALGLRVGYDRIFELAEALGLGRKTGIEVDAELAGSLRRPEEMRDPVDVCRASIGLAGGTSVTAIQMAMITAIIANGGCACKPRLILSKGLSSAPHSEDPVHAPIQDLPCSLNTMRIVRRGMHDVIHGKEGTGKNARVDGVEIAGKTGTSDLASSGDRRRHCWMIAYAPYQDPKYAVALVLENVRMASRTVAPRVGTLLGSVLGHEKTDVESLRSRIGIRAGVRDLQVGQTVEIHGHSRGSDRVFAGRIEILKRRGHDRLRGPILRIDVRENRLTLLSVNVFADSETQIHDENGNPVEFLSLQQGSNVKVKGRLRADGALCATKISVKDAASPDEIQIVGAVERIDQAAGTLIVLGLTVHITPATAINAAAGSAVTNSAQPIETFPLSPMQQGMLFHTLYAPDSGVYIEQLVGSLHEKPNISAFKRAWQQVVERHSILRTTFEWEDLDEPLQHVHEDCTVSFHEHDWRECSPPEQEKRLASYLRLDRQRQFNLTQPPLMRLALLRLGDARYDFIWTFHHALLDGESVLLVLKELIACYEAYSRDRSVVLPRPLSYREYIDWLRTQDFGAARAYWQKQLKDFTQATPLVVYRPDHTERRDRHGYGEHSLRLTATLTSALESLAQEHQLTLNTLAQGAWALLLSRYSGQKDVVFGATRRCRRPPVNEAGSMVGLFINTLPVRVRVPDDISVVPWLKQLWTQWFLVAYRGCEQTSMVDVLAWSDVAPGKPLFESLLVFEQESLNDALHAHDRGRMLRDLRLLEQTNYPLTVLCYGGRELLLKVEYDRRSFDEATIGRMLGHLRTLLEAMVANPEQRVSKLPLLTREEEHQLLVEWNESSQADSATDLCIHELFEAQVQRTPEGVAVVFGDECLTYRDLNSRADRLARRLRRLGVGPEVLVAVSMERSLELVVGLLAILKAGGAYVPLDPAYPSERAAFMLEDSAAGVLLAEQRVMANVTAYPGHVVFVDSVWDDSESDGNWSATTDVGPHNLAYVIYTSGSTGAAKGVAIEHHSAVTLLRWAKDVWTPAELAGVLASTSICFDLSVFEIFAPLSWGGTVIMADNVLELSALTASRPVTLVNTVPSAMVELLRAGSLPDSVRVVNLAGEPLSPRLVNEIHRRSSAHRVFDLYGPTEATTYSTCALRNVDSPATIGRPVAGTQVYILDDNLRPAPIGIPGELYIGGAGLARGYHRRDNLNAARFIPHPFSDAPRARLYKTGDVARFRPDGAIEWLGRLDDQVKIRGFRIELGEVEAALNRHRSVHQAAVIAVDDAENSKRLAAFVMPERDSAPTRRELRSFLQQTLPEYMIPSSLVLLDALPLTPNGKVDRRALPAMVNSRQYADESPIDRGRTPVEEILTDIWTEVLDLEQVGVHDNFFELGGHSLLAAQVISRIRKTMGIDLPLRSLFEAATIAELAEIIKHAPTRGA